MSESILFYQPIDYKSISDENSGTVVRPREMKQAFENIGYNVIDITGSTKERTAKVKRALNMNPLPVFMYIESANIPMCLSNNHHLPIAFFSDFKNIKRVQKHMKVGLFYRDVYWKYPNFKEEVGTFRFLVLKPLFFFEFCVLKNLLDVIFVPCQGFAQYLPRVKGKASYIDLPGGCSKKVSNKYTSSEGKLKILFSGNLTKDEYNIGGFLDIMSKINDQDITLTINTNKGAYDRSFEFLKDKIELLIDRNQLSFVFASYNETELIEEQFNVAIIYNSILPEVLPIYMPLKLFHYIAMGLPIIARKESGYGKFIEDYDIGWTFSNDDELLSLLLSLKNNPEEIQRVAINVKNNQSLNTWEKRAETASMYLNSVTTEKGGLSY